MSRMSTRKSSQSVGVTAERRWMEDGKFTEEGGAEAAEAILDREPDVTALFAGNDKMALGALHYLSRQGVRCAGTDFGRRL